MNQNRLFKILKKTEESFKNLDTYEKILTKTPRTILDFRNFKNFDSFADKCKDRVKTEGLSFPFDNTLLDIHGLSAAHPITGEIVAQDLLLHVVPIKMTTDISTFHIMLVQDLRPMEDDIFPRNHIVTLDGDIASMPAVDDGMSDLGCRCFMKNPISHGQVHKMIQTFTPGFAADCGFALGHCNSEIDVCKHLLECSNKITAIAIAAVTYSTLPGHTIYKVTDPKLKQDGLKSMPHYVVCDKSQVDRLQNKQDSGFADFQDAADFESVMGRSPLEAVEFNVGNFVYSPVQA